MLIGSTVLCYTYDALCTLCAMGLRARTQDFAQRIKHKIGSTMNR